MPSDAASTADITRLLKRWGAGEEAARDILIPLIYERLMVLAHSSLKSVPSLATLRPTALVNEAFLKIDNSRLDIHDRGHFYALAARVMRQVLVDRARSSSRAKRGGGQLQVTLSNIHGERDVDIDMLALDQALDDLARFHARAAETVQLSYLAGFSAAEIAEHLGVSPRTVERDQRFGRTWLRDRLFPD